MEFSEDLKLRVTSYFKEKYNLDLSDSEVIDILNNLSDLYLAFTNIDKSL